MLDAYCTTGGSPPTQLILVDICLDPDSTTAHGHGIDKDGAEVTFEGDWEPMAQLANRLATGEYIQVRICENGFLIWGQA